MTQSKPSLRIATHVIKRGNFPPGVPVFSNPEEEAAWKDIPVGRVLENHATLENGIYGSRINPVNCPAKSFFIPEDFFTTEYFTASRQPLKFDQPADIRR